MLRARGEALIRSSSPAEGPEGCAVSRMGVGPAGCGAAGAAVLAAPFEPPEASMAAFQSSPALPITAITPLMGTGPSFTAICKMTPSTKLSNSMVALSVSTSAMVSPILTLSPSFFNQLTILPSSMVSLMRGMRMISAI